MYNKTCARYFVAPFPAEKVHRTAVVLQSTTSVNINSEKRDVNDLFGTQTVDLRGASIYIYIYTCNVKYI